MEEPPVRKYLIYALLLSVIVILSLILYQHLVIFDRTTTMDISQNLIDFTILNYTYRRGKYYIYVVPTSRVIISKVRVNDVVLENISGKLEKDTPIVLEGESEGELTVKITYKTTGLEHTGYAIIPEN